VLLLPFVLELDPSLTLVLGIELALALDKELVHILGELLAPVSVIELDWVLVLTLNIGSDMV